MEIKDTYIRRYWEKIVADQLADELLGKGYQVDKEKKVGDLCFDLYATKMMSISFMRLNKVRFLKIQ